MSDIIIISLLVLIFFALAAFDVLIWKAVTPKAREEPCNDSGVLNTLLNAAHKTKKPDSWHERWEKGK
ncbi:MAG: hypothetical protein IKU60_03790 [Clostridia bacterium]|nr:hypothetical protein [Clostridia bacterium]